MINYFSFKINDNNKKSIKCCIKNHKKTKKSKVILVIKRKNKNKNKLSNSKKRSSCYLKSKLSSCNSNKIHTLNKIHKVKNYTM